MLKLLIRSASANRKSYVVGTLEAPREAPLRGNSDEYPQHMFLWRNKKNTSPFGLTF